MKKKRTSHFKTLMTIIVSSVITFTITILWLYGSTDKINKASNPLNSVLESDKMSTRLKLIKEKIKDEYLGEINEEELDEYALRGYVVGLQDKYSEYISYDEMQAFTDETLGSYVGIGVYITRNETDLLVHDTIENSPARSAGLKEGDIIKAVDGKEYTAEDFETISDKIKGKEGTKVKLTIEREGKTLDLEIERKSIDLIRVSSKMLQDNIGYIYISTFDGKVASQVESAYDKLKQEGATSLIIDVRDNGGGLVNEALDIGDMLTEKGKTLLIESNKNKKETKEISKKDKKIDMNFVLLTNKNSASASEILAAIVKEQVDNGKIVGTTTYGKGVIQTLYTLADGSGLKLTTDEYFTPNHNTINEVGIKPDYEVEGTFDKNNIDPETDKQLEKAIEVLKDWK